MIEQDQIYVTGIGAAGVVLVHTLLVGFQLTTAIAYSDDNTPKPSASVKRPGP